MRRSCWLCCVLSLVGRNGVMASHCVAAPQPLALWRRAGMTQTHTMEPRLSRVTGSSAVLAADDVMSGPGQSTPRADPISGATPCEPGGQLCGLGAGVFGAGDAVLKSRLRGSLQLPAAMMDPVEDFGTYFSGRTALSCRAACSARGRRLLSPVTSSASRSSGGGGRSAFLLSHPA